MDSPQPASHCGRLPRRDERATLTMRSRAGAHRSVRSGGCGRHRWPWSSDHGCPTRAVAPCRVDLRNHRSRRAVSPPSGAAARMCEVVVVGRVCCMRRRLDSDAQANCPGACAGAVFDGCCRQSRCSRCARLERIRSFRAHAAQYPHRWRIRLRPVVALWVGGWAGLAVLVEALFPQEPRFMWTIIRVPWVLAALAPPFLLLLARALGFTPGPHCLPASAWRHCRSMLRCTPVTSNLGRCSLSICSGSRWWPLRCVWSVPSWQRRGPSVLAYTCWGRSGCSDRRRRVAGHRAADVAPLANAARRCVTSAGSW